MGLLLITLCAALANYARFTLTPLAEAVKGALALTDDQMALLQGPALALPIVILGLPLGWLIDRTRRVRVLLALVCATAAGSLLTAYAPDYRWLIAARSVVGFSATASALVSTALIADWFTPAARGRASMMVTLASLGAISLALAAGGALLIRFGAAGEGWREAMLWLAAPLPLAILAALFLREPPRTERIEATELKVGPALRRLAGYRSVIAPIIAGGVMVGIADGAALVWSVPALIRGLGLAPDAAGALMGGVMLASGIAGPLLGGLGADICQRAGGPRRTVMLLAAFAMVSAPAGLFGLVESHWLATLLLGLFMSVGGAISVIATTFATIVIPNELRGLTLSIKYVANLLFGLALAPLAVSRLAGLIGGPAMIGAALALVACATSVTGALIFLAALRSAPTSSSAVA